MYISWSLMNWMKWMFDLCDNRTEHSIELNSVKWILFFILLQTCSLKPAPDVSWITVIRLRWPFNIFDPGWMICSPQRNNLCVGDHLTFYTIRLKHQTSWPAWFETNCPQIDLFHSHLNPSSHPGSSWKGMKRTFQALSLSSNHFRR